MSLFGWMKRHSEGELLVAKAMAQFALGNRNNGMLTLIDGLIELSENEETDKCLKSLKDKLIVYGFVQ